MHWRELGRLTLVGSAMGKVNFGLLDIPWGAQLTTSMNGGTVNLREIVELARLGRIETKQREFAALRIDIL